VSEFLDHPEFWAAVREQYVPVRVLGRGGMATVVLARERGLERLVAVKRLDRDPASEDDRERFRRESRILAGLRHPSVVAIYALGEAVGAPYMVLEYVPGEPLGAWLAREDRLPHGTVIRLLSRLADALAVVHRAGVVHRDVKPDNVLVDPDGRPVLSDFGVATVASSDHSRSEIQKAQGTPAYMAPEQIMGDQDVTGRCDLYSLGVVGYQLLAGRLPFDGAPHAVAAQHITQEPAPLESIVPGLAPALARAIHRCLAKRPRDRWPDAGVLRDALDRMALVTPVSLPGREVGALDLLLLRIASHEPANGFDLTQRLRAAADDSFPFEEGELYAALHRMQAAGFLEVEWGATATGRRVRFYRVTGRGHRRLHQDGGRYLAQAEMIIRVMRRRSAAVA